MSGTPLAYGPNLVRCYAMSGTSIEYLMSGTPIAYGHISSYAMSGTPIEYGPTSLRDVRYHPRTYRTTDTLADARY
eukprot:277998-Rhodomonas_salina.4